MKQHIQQLYDISKKKERTIIGLMSGTSLDGLDIALCQIRGAGTATEATVTHFVTVAYSRIFKQEILEVFAKKHIDFQHLTLLNGEIAEIQAEMVLKSLKKWGIAPDSVDLIASHGQTVFHAPRRLHGIDGRGNGTLQLGDGDHLAVRTGIITVSDFRQKHIAVGGEGAPLALFGDVFLFSKKGRNRFLLNLGGIANFTYLPADGDISKAFATDTGPGNTLMDLWARTQFGADFDENAQLALSGRVEPSMLAHLKKHPYFSQPVPKTTGPELFGKDYIAEAMDRVPKGFPNPYDVMNTLSQFTAETVAEEILKVHLAPSKSKPEIYLSGGGAHNPLLEERLRKLLPDFQFFPMEKLGIHGDAKEAVLFAILANQTVAGAAQNELLWSGVPLPGMGKISFPG